jgi:hypothetical protein
MAKQRRPRYHADGYFILSEEMLDGLIRENLLAPNSKYDMNQAQDALVQFLTRTLCNQKHIASQGIKTGVIN